MLGTCLENVRNTVPLVHNITNYVTVNDVANILLACGGSPIMSDEPEDVEDITSICGGLNINIGTLNQRSIEGMFRAGAKANALGHVVLLDPVGAGASALRTNTAVELMEKIKFTVIRGNISEIKTLALGSGTTKGVDAAVAAAVTVCRFALHGQWCQNVLCNAAGHRRRLCVLGRCTVFQNGGNGVGQHQNGQHHPCQAQLAAHAAVTGTVRCRMIFV